MPRCQGLLRLAAAIAVLFVFLDASPVQGGEWQSLDSLDAWRGYGRKDLPASWKVDPEGAITLEGTGGDIITRERFGDFELEFEWKIAPGGNSGVMTRVSEEADPAYHTGPEYQVFDESAYPETTPDTKSGSLYALYARTAEVAKPAGEWNTARIVRDGARIEHWLNGQQIVGAEVGSEDWNRRVAASKFSQWPKFAKNAAGHIALQDHGSQVWYRNVRVRELGGMSAATMGGPKRILLVTQSAGFKHSTVSRKAHELSHTERTMQELGVRSGDFRVDCTQDAAKDFTPELLANYDVVAFFTTGDLPIPEGTREWFLNTWLADEGHAFLGLHAAADTYHDYQPYWDMIGGTFDGHPWTAETKVVLRVHDGDHPASRPWGSSGSTHPITDEVYQFKHWQPEKVRVLMSLDMEQTDLKAPRHVPVLWVKNYGAGRVMHMSLGHREDVWTNPVYQESLIGGVRWLLKLDEGDATPNPELSAAEEGKARAAYEVAQGE
jgi:type 1 glutamine amidotransferase